MAHNLEEAFYGPENNTKQEGYDYNYEEPMTNEEIEDLFKGVEIGDDGSQEVVKESPEIIVARVLFSLVISVALIINLLLTLAVIRRRRTVHAIYMLTASLIVADVVFYVKVITELVDWTLDAKGIPSWSSSDGACGLWMFSTHFYPILYAAVLLAIVYHSLVTLFLDYSGGYEEKIRKFFPGILIAILVVVTLIVAPSGFYGKSGRSADQAGHFRQFCDVRVPTLMPVDHGDNPLVKNALQRESTSSYRLVYELVLPYMLPLVLIGFPYITLMLGLMRNAPAASHSDHLTKMTVVVTLWLITSYLMLHVTSVLRNVFSVLNVWHRLMSLFDAHDDVRVPRFQTYIHVVAYMCTCIWSIVRAGLCFRYNPKLRKALGPPS